jgi:hypothetical protein
MDGMNTFEVRRYSTPALGDGTGRIDVAVPVIDGLPFFERFEDREPGSALRAATSARGQWLGAPLHVEEGRAVVLDGTCGHGRCCGVLARIEVDEELGTVRWHDFSTNEVDADFTFNLDEYRNAIAHAGDLEAQVWEPPPDE